MLRVRQRTKPPNGDHVTHDSPTASTDDLPSTPNLPATSNSPLTSNIPSTTSNLPFVHSPFSSFSSSRLNFYVLLSAFFCAQLFLSLAPSTFAAPRFAAPRFAASSSSFSSSSSFRNGRSTWRADPDPLPVPSETRVTKIGPGDTASDAELYQGKIILLNKEKNRIRLYGTNITTEHRIKLNSVLKPRGEICAHLIESDFFPIVEADSNGLWGEVVVDLASAQSKYVDIFLCLGKNESSALEHQGGDFDVVVQFKNRYSLPFGLQVFLLILLLFMSGMFSGLNLGLMSLDKTELQILINVGTEQEKRYAKKIQPIRNKGNYLLCTVLLSNVLVNSTLTILMDELTGGGGLIAIVGSTLGIVIFGEIIPQAVCSRYGLAVGAGTIWIMKFFMLITFPLSFPVSILLDFVLGEEIGNVYSRDRLRELLKITASHHDIKGDEIKMISGALSLTEKTVKEVMTNLEDVYALPMEAVMDFQTMSDILKRGYTRIPIYEDEKTNIVGLLNIRDLAFVDPDDATPLKTLCNFYQHSILSVHDDKKLDKMLEVFKEGQCHMALVETVNNSGQGDPYYEVIGLVTLEDVIEEIIQAEIVDETDVVVDNRKQILRTMPDRGMPQPEDFVDGADPNKSRRISPQLSLAVFQFLSAQVEPFTDLHLTPNILKRLLKKSEIVVDLKHSDAKPVVIFQKDRPSDFFCFILEGSVQCSVGKDDLVYETGAFSHFGAQALLDVLQRENSLRASRNIALEAAAAAATPAGSADAPGASPGVRRRLSDGTNPLKATSRRPTYIPDFTVVTTAQTQILKITRSHYVAARRASELEKARSIKGISESDETIETAFNKEWKKIGSEVSPLPSPEINGGVVNNAFVPDGAENGTPLIRVDDADAKNETLI